ncbi:MAG TPA: iron chelate uptake ABC transporter family permease subunit, partial [Arthrobacter sp.]|nr:iron chelate uptake ABC transporter family permease subunit [Arthrobacter sp.]
MLREAPAPAIGTPAGRPEPALRRLIGPCLVSAAILMAVTALALASGRYSVPLSHVLEILASRVVPIDSGVSDAEENVVLLVRLPRVLVALLVGGGLAMGGAALQAVFRNPLVSPEVIGVSSGASFGGALALLLGLGPVVLVGGSFLCGL